MIRWFRTRRYDRAYSRALREREEREQRERQLASELGALKVILL